MRMNRTMTKVINGVIIGAMAVAMGSSSFAYSQIQSQKDMTLPKFNETMINSQENRQGVLSDVLEKKVADKTINQEQADKMLEKMKKDRCKKDRRIIDSVDRKVKFQEKLAKKVAEGKMTQEQADKILKNGYKQRKTRTKDNANPVQRERRLQKKQAVLEKKFTKFVAEDIITQKQADEILEAVKEELKNREKVNQ